MKLPAKHGVGRVLFNAAFIVLLSGVVVMIAIPVLTRVCSDMADYAMSLTLE